MEWSGSAASHSLQPRGLCLPGSSSDMLLLLSHFSRVRLCATPSLGFSRQEHCSGLPFPSPMHESEEWKWSHSVVSDSSWPHGLRPTRLLHPRDFPGKSTGVGSHCLLLLWYRWSISPMLQFKKGSKHTLKKQSLILQIWQMPSKQMWLQGFEYLSRFLT